MSEKNSSNGAAKETEIGAPVTAAEIEATTENTNALVEQFKEQAGITEEVKEEVKERTIKGDILSFLKRQDPNLWTNISPLFKSFKAGQGEIKEAITELTKEKAIVLFHNAQDEWGKPYGSDVDGKTLYHSIDNLNVFAKIR